MTCSWPRARHAARSSWWTARSSGTSSTTATVPAWPPARRRPVRRERSDDTAQAADAPAPLRGRIPGRGPPAAGGEPVSALGKVVRSGVGRRRVQSFVMALTTFAAVTSSVLSLGLLTAVQAPFEHAFNARNGAHLAVQFDGSKVTAAQTTATARAAGVTEAAGPYPIAAALDTTVGTDCPETDWAGHDNHPITVTT